MSGKLSRTVLRRGKGSNPFSLVEYTSHDYHTYIEDLGITASMSKPGTPIENAPIESFFSTLKVEWLPDTSHMSIEEIALDIDEYI